MQSSMKWLRNGELEGEKTDILERNDGQSRLQTTWWKHIVSCVTKQGAQIRKPLHAVSRAIEKSNIVVFDGC